MRIQAMPFALALNRDVERFGQCENASSGDALHECRRMPRYKGHSSKLFCCVDGMRLECAIGSHACDTVMQTTSVLYLAAAGNHTAAPLSSEDLLRTWALA